MARKDAAWPGMSGLDTVGRVASRKKAAVHSFPSTAKRNRGVAVAEIETGAVVEEAAFGVEFDTRLESVGSTSDGSGPVKSMTRRGESDVLRFRGTERGLTEEAFRL